VIPSPASSPSVPARLPLFHLGLVNVKGHVDEGLCESDAVSAASDGDLALVGGSLAVGGRLLTLRDSEKML
jgi:hypothetical protein